MSLVLSPATEARILQQVATGRHAAPDDLLNHALQAADAMKGLYNMGDPQQLHLRHHHGPQPHLPPLQEMRLQLERCKEAIKPPRHHLNGRKVARISPITASGFSQGVK